LFFKLQLRLRKLITAVVK